MSYGVNVRAGLERALGLPPGAGGRAVLAAAEGLALRAGRAGRAALYLREALYAAGGPYHLLEPVGSAEEWPSGGRVAAASLAGAMGLPPGTPARDLLDEAALFGRLRGALSAEDVEAAVRGILAELSAASRPSARREEAAGELELLLQGAAEAEAAGALPRYAQDAMDRIAELRGELRIRAGGVREPTRAEAARRRAVESAGARGRLRERSWALAEAELRAGAPAEEGVPLRWLDRPAFCCESGHIRGAFLPSKTGPLCPRCERPSSRVPPEALGLEDPEDEDRRRRSSAPPTPGLTAAALALHELRARGCPASAREWDEAVAQLRAELRAGGAL